MLMQNLYVYNIICYRNTLSKASGSGIKIINCKGIDDDPNQETNLPTSEEEAMQIFNTYVGNTDRISLIDNYIIEVTDGYGMIVYNTTCYMDQNQLKKNKLGGLLLITSKKLPKHLQSSKQINDSQTGKTMNSSHGMHDRVNISQVSQKH